MRANPEKMLFMALDIIIQFEGWSDTEIVAIEDILRSHNIEKKYLAQFDSDSTTAIIFVIHMSYLIASGIGNAIGQDIWNKLKFKLSSSSNNNRSTIKFLLKNEQQEIHLDINSHDKAIVQKALDSIDNILELTNPADKKITLYFEPNIQEWNEIIPKKFMKKYICVIADTRPIKKDGKTYQFTKESLTGSCYTAIGNPVTLGHGGKQIGEVTKAWMNNDCLMHEIGIYEGTSDTDLQELQKIIDSGGGLSMGIVFSDKDKA